MHIIRLAGLGRHSARDCAPSAYKTASEALDYTRPDADRLVPSASGRRAHNSRWQLVSVAASLELLAPLLLLLLRLEPAGFRYTCAVRFRCAARRQLA